MMDRARIAHHASTAAIAILLALPLVISPLAGLITPYFIGLVGLLVFAAFLFTGRILTAYGSFTARAYLIVLVIIAISYAASARSPADLAYAGNFLMLLLYGPMEAVLRGRPDAGNVLAAGRLALLGLVLAMGMEVIQVLQDTDRARGFNIGPIVLSNAVLAISVIAVLPLFKGRGTTGLYLLAGPLIAIGIVLLTRSRGPLLAIPPLFLLTAFALWRTRYSGSRLYPWVVLGLVAAAALAAFVSQVGSDRNLVTVIGQLLSGDIEDESTRVRLVLQEAGWKAFMDSPWIGHGWARLMDAVMPYLSADNLPYGRRLPQLHNDVLNFAVSGGVVGILCYLTVLLAPTVAAWRSTRDSFYATRLYGTSALCVLYATAGLTDLMFGHEFHTALFISLNAIILGYCRDEPSPRT